MHRVFPAFLLLLASSGLHAQDTQDMKGLFSRSCAVCHGEDGSGRGPNGQKLGGRDLANFRWQARTRDSEMVTIILKGKGSMPAFGALMSESEALQLVTAVVRPMGARKH